MTKLKLVISRGSYNKLLETMDKANKDLREFTHQNIHLETQRRKRGFKRLPTDYKDIRRRADSLYDAVVAGRSWNCLCKKYHVASLRLEPRPRQPPCDCSSKIEVWSLTFQEPYSRRRKIVIRVAKD